MKTNSSMNSGKKTDGKKTWLAKRAVTKSVANAGTRDGKVVSITGSKLVMSGADGEESSHTVAADAKVTCDDVACRTEDLQVGAKIRLTTSPDENHKAIKVESLNKHTDFAKS